MSDIGWYEKNERRKGAMKLAERWIRKREKSDDGTFDVSYCSCCGVYISWVCGEPITRHFRFPLKCRRYIMGFI
jgi:hypothetical protein